MNITRRVNIFTVLMTVLALFFAFRLINLVTPASAGGFRPQMSNEQAPPLTKDDLDQAVKQTTRKADELAATDAAAPEAKSAQNKDDSSKDAMPAPPENAGSASFSSSEVEVLQSLAKRRDDIDRREKSLAEREALLSAAEQEVDHKISELNKLKGEIENLLGQQQKMADARIDSLVKIYEGMKPKEAATIFNTLEMDVLLPVIGRMNERKSGPILASMDPDKARIVTIRLAQQRELPPAIPAKKADSGQPPQPAP